MFIKSDSTLKLNNQHSMPWWNERQSSRTISISNEQKYGDNLQIFYSIFKENSRENLKKNFIKIQIAKYSEFAVMLSIIIELILTNSGQDNRDSIMFVENSSKFEFYCKSMATSICS